MSKDMHVQCGLVKGHTRLVSWLPREFAKPGRVVKLKNDDGSWDNGWMVETAAQDSALPSKWVQERAQDYKKMRKMTDI